MFVATALAKESQDWRVVTSAVTNFCLEATDRTSNFHLASRSRRQQRPHFLLPRPRPAELRRVKHPGLMQIMLGTISLDTRTCKTQVHAYERCLLQST